MAASSSEVSVTVTELPSKKPLSISLPSEEGGDMIAMEKFWSLVEGKLSKNVVLVKLMMGDRRISKRQDSSRPVHYFLLDNCPWYAYTVSSLQEHPQHLLVKTLTGKRFKISVKDCKTILDVKKRVQHREGIPPDQQRFIMSGLQLNDEDTVIGIADESTLHLVLRLRGGYELPGVPFTDVTDTAGPVAGPVRLEWNNNAPEWRKANRGLCLEGKCTNRRCKAHGHMVIMGVGYKEFDLINDGHKCKCPICEEAVVPITCGFNNCEWKVIGRKIEKLGQPPTMFRSEWKEVGNLYERFSPEKSGKAHFLDLKILCREEPKKIGVCVLCGKEGHLMTMKKAGCGHMFHSGSDGCFDSATSDQSCIECMASQSMTSYQKLFN